MRGELTRVYIARCADCDRAVYWPLDYDSRRASAHAFRKAGWSQTTQAGWLCPACNPRRTVIDPDQPGLFDLLPLNNSPIPRTPFQIPQKEGVQPMPETTITIQLTEETGEMAYLGTATVAQGSTAHFTRFEYFGEDDILAAVSQALAKLRHLQQHPPQLKPVIEKPQLEEVEPDADEVPEPEESEVAEMPDADETSSELTLPEPDEDIPAIIPEAQLTLF